MLPLLSSPALMFLAGTVISAFISSSAYFLGKRAGRAEMLVATDDVLLTCSRLVVELQQDALKKVDKEE